MNASKLYLKLKEFKSKKDYIKKLKSVLNEIKPNSKEKIFKFRKRYSLEISQCAWSLARRKQTKKNKMDEESCDKEELAGKSFDKQEDIDLCDDISEEES